MRKTLTVFAVLAVFVAMMALMGCPSQSPTDQPVPPPTEPPDVSDEPMAGADEPGEQQPEATTQKPDTIGQLMEQIDRPKSYELTITSNKEDESVTQLVMLEDNEPVRMKMKTPDGEIYMDQKKKEMFVYDPAENTAMKMPMDQDVESDLEWKPGDYDKNATIVGSEAVDGVDCWVFEAESDGETVKSWISKDKGLPHKVQMGDEVLTFSYDRVDQIGEDEFELPGDAKMMDLSDMPGASQ